VILLGYILANFMGIILGIMGAGGSILTLPILIYIFKIPVVIATSYSLFIVAITSFFGALNLKLQQLLKNKKVIAFAICSILGAFLSRKYLFPIIPDPIIFDFSKAHFILSLLCIFMLTSAYFMIRECNLEHNLNQQSTILFSLVGLFIGFITSLIGAGGGFMIIPILVLLLKIDIKEATCISLAIISLNTFAGFIADHHYDLDFLFLLKLSLTSIIGILIGNKLKFKLSSKNLKKYFGYFVIIIALIIIIKEI